MSGVGGGVMVSLFLKNSCTTNDTIIKIFLIQSFLCMLMKKEFLFQEYIFLSYEVTHPHSKMIKLRLKHLRTRR